MNSNNLKRIKRNIQYSNLVRGLFMHCNTCSLDNVLIHDRHFEITDPYCTFCGNKVALENCEWRNGEFYGE
jgi:hypothetical protein